MVSKPFQVIFAHWATPYIGQPWSKHGQGPEAWNCWSFFRHVQQVHFGIETPAVPYADDLLVLARLFRDHGERSHWQPVTAYREGDGVMMRTARYPIHVGVWLEAGLRFGIRLGRRLLFRAWDGRPSRVQCHPCPLM